MKNLFTFLYCLFATTFVVNAQNVLFEDDFQTGTFPSTKGYTLLKNDSYTAQNLGNNAAWSSVRFTNTEVTNLFMGSSCALGGSNVADRWSILPKITLDTADNNWLFYVVRNGGGSNNSYEVLVSTTDQNPSSFTQIYSEANAPGSWKEVALNLSGFEGEDVYIAFRNVGYGGTIIAIDDIIVASNIAFADAEVRQLDVVDKATGGSPFQIKAEVVSRSSDSLGSVDLNWSVDGGTVETQTITGLDLTYGQSRVLTHNKSWTPSASDVGKVMTLKVWTSNPNGQTDENLSNDTLVQEIIIGNGLTVQRNLLFEEFTTAGCVHCPDGHIRASQLLAQNPNAIAVNIHSCFGSDAMTNTHASNICSKIGSNSAPTGMVDRILYDGESHIAFGRGSWIARANVRSAVGSEAAISFENASYNSTTRNITFDVITNFVDLVQAGDLRLSLMIVEDSLTGTGTGWDQRNAGYNVPGYGTGNPLRGYVHRHVLRDIKPSTWGDATVFPNKVEINKEYKKNFSFTLNAGYDINQVSFVAVVSYYGDNDKNNYTVINAKEISLVDLSTGINKLSKEVHRLDIYPNPTAEQTNVEIGLNENTNVEMVLRDITGKVVYEKNHGVMLKGTHQLPIDVSSFANGFYFVNIKVGDAQLSRKIIVNK